MESFAIALLNGLSYGLLLFMLSSGLTLVFGMMGVLNFAHASFYMLGAYLAYSLTGLLGFWPALLLAPLLVGLLGAGFECYALRRAYALGHVSELMLTFGLGVLLLEGVQLVWGTGPVHHPLPPVLEGPWFSLHSVQFPRYRGFVMLVSLLMLLALWLLLARTRTGLLIQAALTHPQTLQTLGHNVPRLFTLVFAYGAGLAGLAGVIGGNLLVTEPGMAAAMGSVVFVVVVVGGMGSLPGALAASLLIGVVQTFAVSMDRPLAGWAFRPSQAAPMLPYLLLVLVLLLRPQGLLGRRDD